MAAAGGLVAVLGIWLAFPARSSVTRSEARRLEGQWLEAQVLDNSRFPVMAELTAAAVTGDEDRVRAGDAALYREEVVRLDTLQRAVHADLLVDRGLSRLRAAMAHALAVQRADLDGVARWYSAPAGAFGLPPAERTPSTVAAIDRAYKLLDGQLHHLGLTPRPLPASPRFHSANPILAFMSRIANTPTGTQLIVATQDGLLLSVDIDANRITPAHLAGLPASFQPTLVVARRSYVVVGDGNGQCYIAPPNLQGPIRALPASCVTGVAAANPDDAWLQRLDRTLAEIDGRGRVLVGPVPFPGRAILFGAVDGGLVLGPLDSQGVQTRLIVWNPTTQTTVRTLTTSSNVVMMAAEHDTVVWLHRDTSNHLTVHLSTVSTGLDRTVTGDPNLEPTGDQWSISPDGTTVASVWWTNSPSLDALIAPAFISLSTGRLTQAPVALSAPAPSTIEWANSGNRVFVTNNNGSSAIFTYQVGSNSVEQLRLHNVTVLASAVVVANSQPGSP